MTEDDNTNDRNPSADGEYIPSSVRKAGAEARIAEKKASEEWVHVDDLHDLVERWRRWADRPHCECGCDCEPNHWDIGYDAALRTCVEELETQLSK